MTHKKLNRRDLIKKAGVATALFSIVPAKVVVGSPCDRPSNQLTYGVIGTGGQGSGHIHPGGDMLGARLPDVLIGSADCDSSHHTGGGQKYTDWRELMARDDIDIINIATPPHWHGTMALAAIRSGKDVWCEKPMTYSIGEGKAIVDAVKKHGTIFRVNTIFRYSGSDEPNAASWGFLPYFGSITARDLRKLVDSGDLGSVGQITAHVGGQSGYDWKFNWNGQTSPSTGNAPGWYDMWLGPRPWKPFASHRTHQTFRGYWDYDGGGLGDMSQHYLDPLQYLLGKDDESPVEVSVITNQQHAEAVGNWQRVTMKYADGMTIMLHGIGDNHPDAGKLLVGSGGKFVAHNDANVTIPKAGRYHVENPGHTTDFLEAVRTRTTFALNESNGHRSSTLVNMAKIALQLNRDLKFDSDKQVFIDDDEANRMAYPAMRSPWQIDYEQI